MATNKNIIRKLLTTLSDECIELALMHISGLIETRNDFDYFITLFNYNDNIYIPKYHKTETSENIKLIDNILDELKKGALKDSNITDREKSLCTLKHIILWLIASKIDISDLGLQSFDSFSTTLLYPTDMHPYYYFYISEFNCSSNKLTTLLDLPEKLSKLDCYNNQLTSLPDLPQELNRLNCRDNQLTKLPKLPHSLSYLTCYNNKFTTLPNLPYNLLYLDCSKNKLTSIPPLPDKLKSLYCKDNDLIVLPPLPSSLTYLDCSNNPNLTALPNIPAQGKRLKIVCKNTGITNFSNVPSHVHIIK